MRLIEMEIARQDWKGMLCGCGNSAEHLARDLMQLAGRGPEQRPIHVSLEGHVWSPPVLWEPAPAVTSVALAALADKVAPPARTWFLDLLQRMVAGEATDWESAHKGFDLPEMCRVLATQGIWLLYEKAMSDRSPGTAGAAFEILTVSVFSVATDRVTAVRSR
ncbi:hypothetical protein [Streptomyces globisporus]|uniref:hypothetical protein n=1 Tax=Streptomyces globisporus TaxID=1908 RepID=UPI0004C6F435|nr:hypothetical protein [Streptomyces globisporus]